MNTEVLLVTDIKQKVFTRTIAVLLIYHRFQIDITIDRIDKTIDMMIVDIAMIDTMIVNIAMIDMMIVDIAMIDMMTTENAITDIPARDHLVKEGDVLTHIEDTRMSTI